MKQETEIRRNFQTDRKVFFKDIMLPKKDLQKELENYKSDYIKLQEFDKKLYIDPMYSEELPISNVVYANFNGDWIVDARTDDYGMEILKFTDDKSGQYFELAFPDVVNKIKFASEVYTSKPIKQENPGMTIGKLASANTMEKDTANRDLIKIGTAISGMFLAIVSAFWIKKKMQSK